MEQAMRKLLALLALIPALALGQSPTTINVLGFPGADVGAKLQAAITAAPAGAIVDATSVRGSVAAASTVTISKPVRIRWGDSAITFAACPGVTITAGGAGTEISGMGQLSQWVTSATANCNLLYLNATSDVKISGMNFTATAQATDTANPVRGIYVYQSSHNDIWNNYFSLTNYGIHIGDDTIAGTNPTSNHVHHNLFLSAYGPNNGGYGILNTRSLHTQIDHNIFDPGPFGRHGIYISAGSRKTHVDHNTVNGTTLAMLAINSGTGAGDAISDLIADANILTGTGTGTANAAGVTVTGGLTNSQLVNNLIKSSPRDGITIQAASAVIFPSALVIANNQISGSYNQCIAAYDIQTTLIVDNRCGGNMLDGVSQAEIDIGKLNSTNGALSNTIRNNRTDSSMLYGVRLDATSGKNYVSGTVGTTTRNRVLDNGNGSAGINYVDENKSGIQTSATATGTMTIDTGAGSIVQWTLTGNVTVATTTYSPLNGQTLEFVITQDGTGGRTMTWPGTFKQAWVDTGNTAGKVSSIKFIFDGTNWQQVGAQMVYH